MILLNSSIESSATPRLRVIGYLVAFALFVYMISRGLTERKICFRISMSDEMREYSRLANPAGYWSVLAFWLAALLGVCWLIIQQVP